MAENKGSIYERELCNKMNTAGVVPEGFTPAASDSNAPDIIFYANGGSTYNLEVKLNLLDPDYGQGSFSYDNGWKVSGQNAKMQELLDNIGAESVANRIWPATPNKGTVSNDDITPEMVTQDYQNFKTQYEDVSRDMVFDYYASKNTYYIQIGGYGMYYMKEDPAGLESRGVPQFNGGFKLRYRLKRTTSVENSKGAKYNYRFSTALKARANSKPTNTPVDLDDISEW